MNADRFEIREVDVSDSSSPEEIGLYIDGELSSLGDESIARSITTPDYTNPKYPFVINKVIEAIRLIFMGLILSVVYAIFCTIQSGSTPFSKKCVNYLRVVALLTILLGVVPSTAHIILNFIIYNASYVQINPVQLFIVLLGVVIGMISEIYRYGTALQDDIDSIA